MDPISLVIFGKRYVEVPLLFPNVYHFGLMWVNIWSSCYFLSLLLFKKSGSAQMSDFLANVSGNVPPSHPQERSFSVRLPVYF